MFARISNSWSLVKASWAVLRADKELIIFPIIAPAAAAISTTATPASTHFPRICFPGGRQDRPPRGYTQTFCSAMPCLQRSQCAASA